MKDKTRILWLSDCSVTNNSGFSHVSLELLTRLSKNQNYEIAELGINNPKGENYKQEPTWKVYFSGVKQHCEDRFLPVVADFKPDVVITLLDTHMFSYINNSAKVPTEVRNSFRLISHLPIDGAPFDSWGLDVIAGCNAVACIHQFGEETLKAGYTIRIEELRQEVLGLLRLRQQTKHDEDIRTIENLINLKVMQAENYARILDNTMVINHGVDLDTYHPVTEDDKYNLRHKLGIPQDEFVFVYWGRNSPRKQQPIVMEAFNSVVKKYPKSRLILGCQVRDCGWDLADVAKHLGMDLTKLSIVGNSSDGSYGLTDKQVAEFYQASDCHVSPCVGGGFELTSLESMACGLPQIAVKGAGSLTKMTQGHGILVPAESYFLGGQHGPHRRPLVKPHDLANAMKQMVKDETKRKEWSKAAVDFSKQECFSWDHAAKEFTILIDNVMQDVCVAVEAIYE